MTFPGPDVLKKLPTRVQQVFQIKIVEHSDVYYAPFIDKFFDRLEEAGLPPAEDPYALTTEELEGLEERHLQEEEDPGDLSPEEA